MLYSATMLAELKTVPRMQLQRLKFWGDSVCAGHFEMTSNCCKSLMRGRSGVCCEKVSGAGVEQEQTAESLAEV